MNICPRCGMQYVEDTAAQYTAPQNPTPQSQNPAPYGQQGYPQQNYGQQPYQQPVYQAYPAPAPVGEQMTVGNWIATIFLTQCLSVISLILLFVWGFSDNVPLAKKNYCRAMLIFEAIAIGLVILFLILMAAAGASLFEGIGSSYYA